MNEIIPPDIMFCPACTALLFRHPKDWNKKFCVEHGTLTFDSSENNVIEIRMIRWW